MIPVENGVPDVTQPYPSGAPEEITRFTGEPSAAELPLAGSWLITLPVATVLLLCWVRVPIMSFAPVMAVVAAS